MIKEAANKNITISTITNGSLLDNNIENILTSGLSSVHISLESTNPATFYKIRGGNIDNIFKNIKLIIDLRNKIKSATPFLGFSVTVLKETKDDLNQVFIHYQDMAMDGGIIIQPLNEMSSYTANYNDEVVHQALDNSDLIMIDDELRNNKILKEIQTSRLLNATFFEGLRHDFNAKQDGCPWLLRGLFVNFLGHAMPCSMIKNIEQYSFGHVGRDSAESILGKREYMREQLLIGNIPEACKNCRTLDPNYKPGKMYQYLDH
jgi:MoaA/NifB/PqqE/SkfB family radical SAM enzyme